MPAATVPMMGCSPTASSIQADGNALAQALSSIAAIEQATNPSIAAQLTQAANGLKAAVANFTLGSPSAILNDAATAAEVALSLVPQTAAIAPLVPIAVAALQVLLGNIPGFNGPTPAPAATVARVALPRAYLGYQAPHKMFRSKRNDFIAGWNGVVAQHPELKSAHINQNVFQRL